MMTKSLTMSLKKNAKNANTSMSEGAVTSAAPARRIPHTEPAAFVSTVGRVTCRHGASRRSLIKKERSTAASTRLPACGCNLAPLSLRGGIKLGKFPRVCGPVSMTIV